MSLTDFLAQRIRRRILSGSSYATNSAALYVYAALVLLFLSPRPAQSTTYTVIAAGSGSFTTIQACANVAKAGDTCLVYPGAYNEHVNTVNAGTSSTSRVTFKAQGIVTMQGFDIKHPYITVDGFDITGYTVMYQGEINVMSGGSYCQILNNTIHNGAPNLYGIYFQTSSGQGAASCVVRANKLLHMSYPFLQVNGNNHLFVGNYLEHQDTQDYIRLFGSGSTFRRNVFWGASTKAGVGNHPDFVQTFGQSSSECENHLFEENWISDLFSQFAQLNSGDANAGAGVPLYTNVKNITFRRNIIANVQYDANLDIPGLRFENNTFYRMAYDQSGLGFSGSLTRGNASRAVLVNNVFLAGGNGASGSGYYNQAGALYTLEVIGVFVTGEGVCQPSSTCPIANGIYNNLQANSYIDGNGNLLPAAIALTDISQFVLSPTYDSYKQVGYDTLIQTVQLNNNILSSFTVDYNYVAGANLQGVPTSGCTPGVNWAYQYFCEPHGINGGDPKLTDVNNLLGPDGIPFTLDDGLKPLLDSPLCAKGATGVDIGAYSCDPSKVFSAATAP